MVGISGNQLYLKTKKLFNYNSWKMKFLKIVVHIRMHNRFTKYSMPDPVSIVANEGNLQK